MKKWGVILLLGLLCTGCAQQETMETVADVWVQPVMATPREIAVRLPDNAVAPVLDSGGEQMYLCDDYQLILETRTAGDLEETVQSISGFPSSALTVMKTCQEGVNRYDFTWTSAGEDEELIGRAVVLDDGNYHYCLSVLRAAADTKNTQIVWRDVFNSFTLV